MSNEQERQQPPHDDLELMQVVQYRASLRSEDLREVLRMKDGGKDGKTMRTSTVGQRYQEERTRLLSKPGAFKGSPGRSFSRTRSPGLSLTGKKAATAPGLLDMMDESVKSRCTSMDESMMSRCMDESVKSQHRIPHGTSSCLNNSADTATSCTSTTCSSCCCNVLQGCKPMDATIALAEQQQQQQQQPPAAAVLVEAKLVDGADPTLSRDSLKQIIAQLEQRLRNAPIAEVVPITDSSGHSTNNSKQTNTNNRRSSSWRKLTRMMSASDMKNMLKRSTSMGDKKDLAKKISLKRRASMGDDNNNNNVETNHKLSHSSSSSSSSSSMSRATSMDKLMFWRKK